MSLVRLQFLINTFGPPYLCENRNQLHMIHTWYGPKHCENHKRDVIPSNYKQLILSKITMSATSGISAIVVAISLIFTFWTGTIWIIYSMATGGNVYAQIFVLGVIGVFGIGLYNYMTKGRIVQ